MANALPLNFGKRPILSSGSNPHPDQVHTERANTLVRMGKATAQWVANSVSREGCIADVQLQASLATAPLTGARLARRYVDSATANTLDRETRKVLEGDSRQREGKLETLLSSKTPITLERARELTLLASNSPVDGTRDLLVETIRRVSENSTKEQIDQELLALEQSGLSRAMLEQLDRFEAKRKDPSADLSEFEPLFKGEDPNTGKSALRLLVEDNQDIGLINLYLANGTRVGKQDRNGQTEIDHARASNDYFLAAKLQLALNYQTLNDRNLPAEQKEEEVILAAYHFDEGKETFAQAAEKLDHRLATSPTPFTHGSLVCRHSNGLYTSRVVHYPCKLTSNAQVLSLNGDMQIPRFSEHLNKEPDGETLARRPLDSNRCFHGLVEQEAREHRSSAVSRRVNKSFYQGGKSAVLSIVAEGGPGLMTTAAICGAVNGASSSTKSEQAVESVGKVVGGAVGSAVGLPITGTQIGGVVAHTVHLYSPHRAEAAGREFEQHQETIDSILRAGGSIAVVDGMGTLHHITQQNLPAFYTLVTGVALPAYMFYQNWDNSRFRHAAVAIVLLGMGGIGLAALSGASLAALVPPVWVMKITLCLGGSLAQLDWDVGKLKSFVSSCTQLLPGVGRGLRKRDRSASLEADSPARRHPPLDESLSGDNSLEDGSSGDSFSGDNSSEELVCDEHSPAGGSPAESLYTDDELETDVPHEDSETGSGFDYDPESPGAPRAGLTSNNDVEEDREPIASSSTDDSDAPMGTRVRDLRRAARRGTYSSPRKNMNSDRKRAGNNSGYLTSRLLRPRVL